MRVRIFAFAVFVCMSIAPIFGCGDNAGTTESGSSSAPITAPPANAPGVSAQTREQMQNSRQSDAAARSANAARSAPK